jgi:LacI family transcriptional regulator
MARLGLRHDPGRRPAGLKDVAKAAGLSVPTVSRYLNGSLRLPEETVNRITLAIGALNYRPNPHARRLSLGRSDTVGLVVPDISNPFFAVVVAAVEQEADRRGLGVSLFATLNRPGREVEYLRMLDRNHVDGLIFITNHPDDGRLAAMIDRARRVVIADEDVPGARAPRLFCDNHQGGQLAGRELGRAGHRRVLVLGGLDGMISATRRLAGLRAGLAETAGTAEITVWPGEYTRATGREAGRRFADGGRPGTAIFSTADEITVGLLEVLRDRGVRVPDDVSLVGFDDVEPQHLFAPPVSSVRQPVPELGRRALALLLDTDWQSSDAFAEELLPVEFIARGSVAPPAIPKAPTGKDAP